MLRFCIEIVQPSSDQGNMPMLMIQWLMVVASIHHHRQPAITVTGRFLRKPAAPQGEPERTIRPQVPSPRPSLAVRARRLRVFLGREGPVVRNFAQDRCLANSQLFQAAACPSYGNAAADPLTSDQFSVSG
jgi:hypothetical protein